MSAVGFRKKAARFPPHGAWPIELRADAVSALLDYPDTKALFNAIRRNEAPKATGLRGTGAAREPVWALAAVHRFLANRHGE